MQINFFLILGFSFLILIISIIIGWNNLYNSKREINKNIINNEDKKNKYNDYDYDLIIVGGGLSGLTAAYEVNKLTNNSMKILLLEVSSTYGGNSINEIDGINILLNEKSNDINIIKDNFSLFYNDSFEFGQFLSETDLLTKLVNNSHELVDFIFNDLNCNNLKIIKSEGSRFPRTFVSNIPNITTGKYISDKIYNKLKKINSTKILFNSHFIDLLISPNHTIVKGVKYTINNNNNISEVKNISVKSKAVILCTGGYGSDFYTNESILNESLVQLYYFPTFLTKYTRGEGLKISRNKGAELIYQRYGEIYPTCFVNLNDRYNRHKILANDKFRELGAIIINKRGKRFCDEMGNRKYVSQNILKNCDIVTDPKIIKQYEAFMIINEAIKKEYGEDEINKYINEGYLIKYNSFDEFAKDMNISDYFNNIKKSINNYNEGSEKKFDQFGKRSFPHKFKIKGKIYVAIVTPCTYHTLGGVHVTDDGEIINTKDRIIDGLFAAGQIIGGVHGTMAMQGNILTQSMVFGRIAAKSAVDYIMEEEF